MALWSPIKWSELADYFFPRLEGSESELENRERRKSDREAEEIEEAIQNLPSDDDSLKACLADADRLIEKEQSRKQSVEARLTSIIGLMSIAATVVLSGLLALAAGTLSAQTVAAKWILVLGSLYLALQLYVALSEAVKGLSRSASPAETGLDLFPHRGMKESYFLRTRITRKLMHLAEYRRVTNAKVSRMAVAHVALRNFLFGLLFLAGAAGFFAIDRDLPKSAAVCSTRLAVPCEAGHNAATTDNFSGPRFFLQDFKASDLLWPAIGVTAGIVFAIVGAFLVLAGPPVRRVGLGLALIASGMSLSLLGGSKLELLGIKFENLVGRLELHLFEQPAPAHTRIVLTRLATIGPFPDGDHQLNEGRVLECLRDGLKPFPGSSIAGWQIVGRVDKRALRADRAAIYGSNQALAMARAVWVRDHLLAKQEGFDPANVIVSVGGARRIGGKVGDADLKSDRAVDIYVLVERKWGADDKSAPATQKAIICPQ